MTKLTTERLEYYAALPTSPAERKAIFMYEVRCMARQLLAYEQAAKNPVAEMGAARTPLYAAPVLPKQPELIGVKVSIDTGSDNIGHRLFGEIVGTSDSNGVPVLCIEVTENNDAEPAPAQPASEPYKLNGWISVNDRLPENKSGSYEYLVFDELNNKVNHDYWNVPDGIGEDFKPFWNHYGSYVTHWMPLPAVPAQEGE